MLELSLLVPLLLICTTTTTTTTTSATAATTSRVVKQEQGWFFSPLCTTTVLSQTTVSGTVFETCGFVPESGVPACSSQRSDRALLRAAAQRNRIRPTKRIQIEISAAPELSLPLDAAEGGIDTDHHGVSGIESSLEFSGRANRIVSSLRNLPSFLSSLIFGCDTRTVSRVSTVFSVVTQEVRSAYTCLYTDLILPLPVYRDGDCEEIRICSEVTVTKTRFSTVTESAACGFAPFSNIAVCNQQQKNTLRNTYKNYQKNRNETLQLNPEPLFRSRSEESRNTSISQSPKFSYRKPRYLCVTNTVTITTTVPVTVTDTVSSAYSCFDTSAKQFLPAYPLSDCSSMSLCSSTFTRTHTVTALHVERFTCGTVPAGLLQLCSDVSKISQTARELIEPSEIIKNEITPGTIPEIESSLSLENLQANVGDCVTWLLSVTSLKTMTEFSQTTLSSAYSCYDEHGFVPVYPQGPCNLFEASVNPKCEVIRDSLGGSFTSPDYPNPYAENLDVCWIILAPEGSVITLAFSDFDVESPLGTAVATKTQAYCPFDVVKISDEVSFNANGSSYFACGEGSVTPNAFVSTSGFLYVQLLTDVGNSVPHRGFLADYLIA